MTVFRVVGAEPALTAALDSIHIHCEVLGVVEGDGEFTVAIGQARLPPISGVRIEALDASAPHATGLEHDHAIQLAPDLLVRPPWVPAPSAFSGIQLVVPRAMAFGSGEHDSTQSALLAMHRFWRVEWVSCCDVGTGSGILLAYAGARGCLGLSGCDIEAESVAAAQELVPNAVIVLGGPHALPSRRDGHDVVLANLALHELSPALDTVLALWNRRGILVLAGTRGEDEAARIASRVPARHATALARGAFVAQVFVS